jgi:hypothetical protein
MMSFVSTHASVQERWLKYICCVIAGVAEEGKALLSFFEVPIELL